MDSVFNISAENTTKKRPKINRSRTAIANKIVAFHEILALKQTCHSAREVAAFLEIPNSTMKSWREQKNAGDSYEVEEFINKPAGAAFLNRIVIAAMKSNKCGPSGIPGMQDFLRNSGLDKYVASSVGALQKFWIRCEVYILEFGECEERRLTKGMSERKITIGLDEMFRARRPCLVAMEAVSNYIFIEKFTEDRSAATWKKELEQRLKGSNFQIGTVVSDLCGAITSVTESIGATHSPDLFHGQYEISKATSASLGSQERAAEKALIKAEEEFKKLSKKPRELIKDKRKQQEEEIATCKKKCDDLKIEHAKKKERREKTKAANKEMGKIHHPIDLNNGSLQSADTIAAQFKQQLDTIEKQVKEAKLSESCFKRIEKARRAFALMVDYMRSFFLYFLPT